jgi:glutamine synthetase
VRRADAADSRVWEQHEIELWLRPLPEAADAVVLTQWVLRNLAQRAGMLCSFAPMARKGHAGSGLHFHFVPARRRYLDTGTAA